MSIKSLTHIGFSKEEELFLMKLSYAGFRRAKRLPHGKRSEGDEDQFRR